MHDMLKPTKAPTQTKYLARIQGRRHDAHGRFYPVEIEFDMKSTVHTVPPDVVDAAIRAANDQGYEVHHLETVTKIKDL